MDNERSKIETEIKTENLYSYIFELSSVSKKIGSFSLKEISLQLPKGYIMGLVGQNGAGKTTLLHVLLGLYKADKGNVRVFDREYAQDENVIREQIGVVLQERLFENHKTLLENGDYYGSFYKQYDREKLLHQFNRFGLVPEKKYKSLSKGEELKFQFAFALSYSPKLLVLDEATGNFDPEFREEFLKELKDFIADGEHSVILSTHLTEELDRIADYIAYMEKGKLLFAYDVETMRDRYRIAVGETYKVKLLPQDRVVHMEQGAMGSRALVRHRRNYPYDKELTVTIPTIEELMYFITKRERGRAYDF